MVQIESILRFSHSDVVERQWTAKTSRASYGTKPVRTVRIQRGGKSCGPATGRQGLQAKGSIVPP
jgi:hypothetical protein